MESERGETMSNLVSMAYVNEQLSEGTLVLMDCRFILGQPDAGREAFEAGHLPGAVYMDLEKDLSGPLSEHGGRHPLPDFGTLTLKLRESGVDGNMHVVVYDDQGGGMASRLWWLLHLLGHPKVSLMEEGYSAWAAAGYAVSTEAVKPVLRHFQPVVQRDRLISMEEVKSKISSDSTVIIDAREPKRYLGIEEPIDLKAGHIPSAINRFWKDALDEQGKWKDARGQLERFADLSAEKEIVVYCGSGVTACPNLLALSEAGYDNIRLYSGSWSDWISYSENPIATGEE